MYIIYIYKLKQKRKRKNGLDRLRLVSVRLRLNQLRPVVEPKETGTDRSLTVPVAVAEFLSFKKPVAVAVSSKNGKKPDRTGLLNTKGPCC